MQASLQPFVPDHFHSNLSNPCLHGSHACPVLCHAGTDLGHLFQLKVTFTATAYKDLLDNPVFPSLWYGFGDGEMV